MNFNERTNTLLYENISLTLYSRKRDISCVWEVSWRRGQTATYWPKVLLTIAALLLHSGWAAQLWSLRAQSPLSAAGPQFGILSPTDTNSNWNCNWNWPKLSVAPGYIIVSRPPASIVPLLIYTGASLDWQLSWGSIYNNTSPVVYEIKESAVFYIDTALMHLHMTSQTCYRPTHFIIEMKWVPRKLLCCIATYIHIHNTNICGNIVNNNDDFNEWMNTLLYKNISLTLYSQKGWCWLCVRGELETGTDCYILTLSSSDHSSTSFSSWLGCSTMGYWGAKALCLPLAFTPASWLQLAPTPTDSSRLCPGYIFVWCTPASAVLPLIYTGASLDSWLGRGSICYCCICINMCVCVCFYRSMCSIRGFTARKWAQQSEFKSWISMFALYKHKSMNSVGGVENMSTASSAKC